jgi:hypothetical protein
MSDTTTTQPPTTAAPKPRQSRVTRPQVSVRPVAVGALNTATIAGATLVAAGAGPLLAVGAAGAAGVAAAAASRKAGKAKADRQASVQRTTTTRTSGGGTRAGRSSSAGTPGGRSSRSGAGRPSAGTRSGGVSPKGRGGSGSPNGGGRHRGSGAGAPGGHRKAGSKPGSGSRAQLTADKVAAARRKLAARRQPGPRLSDAVRAATGAGGTTGRKPTAREAFRTARNQVTGGNPKRRGTIRRAVAGLAAGAVAWDKTQRANWRKRKQQEAARKAKQVRIDARKQQVKPGVRQTVRHPGGAQGRQQFKPDPIDSRRVVLTQEGACYRCKGRILADEWAWPTRRGLIGPCCGLNINASQLDLIPVNQAKKPAPKPVARRNPTGGTPAPTTEGLITMVHPLLALSEDFLSAAHRNQPEGMLQVVGEAHIMPQVLENLAKAMKIRFDRAQEHPLHPSIKDMYGAVHTAQMAVQKASEEIGPAIERIHEKELDRLRNPRVGEEMWDWARNRGAS